MGDTIAIDANHDLMYIYMKRSPVDCHDIRYENSLSSTVRGTSRPISYILIPYIGGRAKGLVLIYTLFFKYIFSIRT
jgi:hypothetical protein